MTSNHRRTPCVGICSTTYGDLVCRGCKRFAHEIVQWNGYAGEQQRTIWSRLLQLRESVIDRYLTLVNEATLLMAKDKYAIEHDSWQLIAWDLLQLRGARLLPVDIGLELKNDEQTNDLPNTLDKEFYSASLAYYERSFRTLAQ